ncbi:MAG: oligosaccharide flippase family protein [Actinobacteria bacterium]|nr:oligosaccharide flippase family protein [Actinomycetota bacterium]
MRKRIRQIVLHPLFSGSVTMIIGSNTVNVINYIYHFVLGRLLGPAGYGELVALISVIGLLGVIPGSLSLVIIKSVSAAKDQDQITILTDWLKDRSFKISLFLFILIAIVSPLIVSFLRVSQIWYVLLIGISFLFSLPALVNRSILQGLLKFKAAIVSILVENAAKLILAAVLVYVGFGIGGAVMGLVVAVILGWYLSEIYLKHPKVDKNASVQDMRSMVLFALPVMIQSFAITSLYSSDVILVKHFFSSHDAGIYSAISTLGKIIFFGAGPIGAVMFPIVARRQSRGEDYKRVFVYSSLATIILSVVILLIYWMLPSFVITLLYNSSYLEAKNLLFWFGLFMSLFTLSSLLINYSLSLGRTKVVLFPLFAALIQIAVISISHQSLYSIIIASTLVIVLLLISLLVYLSFGKGSLWK